jgi:hypothetical protein
MAVPEVKTEVPEGAIAVDVEETSPDEPIATGYTSAAASSSSQVLILSRYPQATQAALAFLGAPPDFEPLQAFELHLQEECGGFHRDQMQRIQDFRRKKDDTPRTMYTRLARFAREFGGVFAESQLVKVFLSKIDKRLLDLALPRIIMEFGGRTTLAEAFAIVGQYDRALCQHDVTDLVSLLVDSSKPRKARVAAAGLAETEVDKTLYCWACGRAGHTKKDCPSKPKHAQNPKRKPIVPAKDSTKGAGNQLPKQMKCSHCGRNNHAVENCFALHPEKRFSTDREKALEAKVGALEERFKNLAASGQISNVPSFSGAQASSSTPDYYMFGASGEIVSSAAVTRAQYVSRATPPTTGEVVERLCRAYGLGTVVLQIILVRHACHCLLAWRMLPNLQAIIIHTWTLRIRSPTWYTHWHPKCCTLPCLRAMEWSSFAIQPAKVFHLAGRILEVKAPRLR